MDDAGVIHVITDVDKGRQSGPALEGIENIFGVRIPREIIFSGGPYVNPLKRVIENGNSDEGDF
jgi:hypothetical protein